VVASSGDFSTPKKDGKQKAVVVISVNNFLCFYHKKFCLEFHHCTSTICARFVKFGSYGNAVPDLDFTSEISALFKKPSVVTSERKLLESTLCPDRALV
jgi:hypothetical protein